MESTTCQNCKKPLSEEILEKEMSCPNCGIKLTRYGMKMEHGNYNYTGYDISLSVIRTVYMKYYHLANEMAHKCNSCEDRSEIVQYSLGTVILSYTAIDCFVQNQTIINDDLKEIVNKLSERGNDQSFIFGLIEQMKKILGKTHQPEANHNFYRDYDLIGKIKILYDRQHYSETLNRGTPTIQQLNLLNDLRVQAVHYKPFRESDEADKEKSIIDIINDSNRKFDLAEDEKEFLNMVYSVGCANWSFNLIEEILNWFCDNFGIEQQTFNPKYEIR